MTRRFFSLLIASVDILASRAKKAAKSRRPAAGIAAGCPGSPGRARILLRTARSRHKAAITHPGSYPIEGLMQCARA